jgi:hypothetical protein
MRRASPDTILALLRLSDHASININFALPRGVHFIVKPPS